MSDAKEVERRLTYRIDGLEERIATLEKQISELTNKKETGAHAHEENKEDEENELDDSGPISGHGILCSCPRCTWRLPSDE